MSANTLSWSNIRPLGGSQPAAFEELCAQIARSETPGGASFVRKGNPDAGVEFFCVLEDGSEWAWQAKFFTSAPTPSRWSQLHESVKTALEKHPSLSRYFVCMPIDRPDARVKGKKSMLDKWNERVTKWKSLATSRGMSVEFCWWGASELIDRLSSEEHAGRMAFWFDDHRRFTTRWFRDRLEAAIETAGDRFTPEVHVDLPIARSLEMFGRAAPSIDSIRARKNDIRLLFQALTPSPRNEANVVDDFRLGKLRSVGDEILAAFDRLSFGPGNTIDLSSIVKDVDRAVTLADASIDAIYELEGKHQEASAEASDGYRRNPFTDWRNRLIRFRREITETGAVLAAAERYVNSNLMIIEGAAGTGKTHLLCDFANQRIEHGLPTVLLMGQQFGTSDDPWRQALSHLDLFTLDAERFAGALEAAAQSTKTRALVIVDALNERRGLEIWPNHLPAFVSYLDQSPWIDVLLSVRSTYIAELVPEHILGRAVVIEHHGFQGNEYESVRKYCQYYGLDFPSTPILNPEFSNPLFLKTICKGLRDAGKHTLLSRFHGISAIFNLYLDAVNRQIAGQIDYDPRENLVRKALEQIAIRTLENGPWILRSDARQIVNSFLPNRAYSSSLFKALISEGVLLQDLRGGSSTPDREFVYITYERFADHIMADYLLKTYFDPEDPAAAFADGDDLGFVFTDRRWLGLVEALCVEVPEWCGQELISLVPNLVDDPNIGRAFLESIMWRKASAFSDDTFAVLNRLIGREKRLKARLYDKLIVMASVPSHPFNARTLDHVLRRLEMPDRDAEWSTYLHYAYGEQGPVDRLLDWASSLQLADQDSIEDRVVDLCAIALGWMLTTSNRFVRDRATKGMVSLLSGRLDAACTLVKWFCDVDDLYVRERIYAVAYGVAMRSYDRDSVSRLATVVYSSVFEAGEPSPHILLRDYARGVIERAIHLGSEGTADPQLFQPPYHSVWPHIPDEDELLARTPHFGDREIGPSDPERSRNRIRRSVMNDDFAFYVIGTNSSQASRHWLSISIDDEQWLSPTERMEHLEASLSDMATEALAELRASKRRVPMRLDFVAPEGEVTDYMLLGGLESGDYITEDDRMHAQIEVDNNRQQFVATLDSFQAQEYESICHARSDGDPRLSLKMVQRYVLGRVFDLGWTIDRFGQFDSAVGKWQGRHARKAERIGKKYQWIAYHEILAYISDHYQYHNRYDTDEAPHRYQGPWQIGRRDIDPSLTHLVLPPTGSQGDAHQAWWKPDYSSWDEPRDHHQWLAQLDDVPDLDTLLRVARSENDTRWVNLRTSPNWTEPSPPGEDPYDTERRDMWVLATAYFVNARKVECSIAWLKDMDWTRWMAEPPSDGDLFVGEHGWGPAFHNTLEDHRHFTIPDDMNYQIPVQMATFGYDTSGGEYDCSGITPQTLYVLHPRVIEVMGLRWSGHGTDYVDAHGSLAAFDPRAYEPGPSALLIREDLLDDYLESRRLAVVWAMTGQKRIISADEYYDAPGWTGSYQYTSQGIKGSMRRRERSS